MSLLGVQGIWVGVVAIAIVLVVSALGMILVFIRRQSWESNRFFDELHLLRVQTLELARSIDEKKTVAPDIHENQWFRFLIVRGVEVEDALHSIADPNSLDDLLSTLHRLTTKYVGGADFASLLIHSEDAQKAFNAARRAVGRPAFRFKKPAADPTMSN